MATATDCPQCGATHTSSIDFCDCGYFLAWTANAEAAFEDEEEGVARIPLEEPVSVPAPRASALPDRSSRPTAEVPVVSGPQCPNGHVNPEGRTLCVRCGEPIRGNAPSQIRVPTLPAPVRTYQPPKERFDWRGLPWPWIGAAVGVVALGVLGWIFFWSGDDGGNPFSPDEQVVEARLDPASITATASSSLPDSGPNTYTIANTLDNDPTTAWNNNSTEAGPGQGETLTFTFTKPVELIRIELINGYARDQERFDRNNRLRDIIVVTDSASTNALLLDIQTLQSVVGDFGTTSRVVIRVESIYPGTGFDAASLNADLALSEILFIVNDPSGGTTATTVATEEGS